MNSYDKFMQLCKLRNVSASRALTAAGLSRALGSKWKQTPDFTPSIDSIQKLCRYFGVSADYFIAEEPVAYKFFREPPEITTLVQACLRMTPEQRQVISKFAQFVYPEAFDEV